MTKVKAKTSFVVNKSMHSYQINSVYELEDKEATELVERGLMEYFEEENVAKEKPKKATRKRATKKKEESQE